MSNMFTSDIERGTGTIAVRSNYTGKRRFMPGYLVDYEEQNAHTIDKVKILSAGKSWHNIGQRNQITRRIPRKATTTSTVVNRVIEVIDDDKNNE